MKAFSATLLLFTVIFSYSSFGQNKEFVDQHALAETLRSGKTGLEKRKCRSMQADSRLNILSKTIIAIANWTDNNQSCKIIIDWEKLGLEASNVKVSIPYIKNYQEETRIQLDNKLNLEGKKGYLIVLEKN
ncbi:DUF6067 family protein [Draconibacterium sp.]|nr:DUF6067 family protein [Draconibacterium sp.]